MRRRRKPGRPRIHASNAARQKAYRERKKRSVHFLSQTAEWATPQDLFDSLNEEFSFDLDVCATAENAKCSRYFTRQENGLVQQWEGACFCNPPYGSQIKHWIKKAYDSSLLGATVALLIPARTDTQYWHDYVLKASEIRYLRGRLRFGGSANSAPFPSAVVVFRPPETA
jgi:phage N-6-adenine-methyltransferase